MSRSARLLALGAAAAVLAPLALVAPAAAVTVEDRNPAATAADWLVSQVDLTGTGDTAVATFAPASLDPITFGYAADAIVSLHSQGHHPDVQAQLSRGLEADLDAYLRPRLPTAEGGTYLSADNAARTVLAAETRDAVTSYGGQDVLSVLTSTVGEDGRATNQGGSQQGIGDLVGQSFAVRAFAATAEAELAAATANALVAARCADGGYPVSFDQETCTSSVDATAYVAIALAQAAGVVDGSTYLQDARDATRWLSQRPLPSTPGIPQLGPSTATNLLAASANQAAGGVNSERALAFTAGYARTVQLDSVAAVGGLTDAQGLIPADPAARARLVAEGSVSDTARIAGISLVSRFYPALGALEGTIRFTDVPAGMNFFPEITWLSGSGVTTGYDQADGSATFAPSQPVLREQMAAFLYRYEHEGTNPAGDSPLSDFTDVAASHVFSRHIAWLAESGITTGYDDGTFRPGQPVLREQMAAFLYRRAGSPEVPVLTTFRDVPTTHRFYREIAWLAMSGITTGYDDGTFRPGQPVLREQMAVFLYRIDHPLFTVPTP